MSDQEWLSRNTDGPDNPYISAQDEKDASKLFANFDAISQKIYFIRFPSLGLPWAYLAKVH